MLIDGDWVVMDEFVFRIECCVVVVIVWWFGWSISEGGVVYE